MTSCCKKSCVRNIIAVVLAILGIITCIYSIAHHFAYKASTDGTTGFACNINSTVSCDAVVASAFSEILGIPLGVFGLGYFLSMLVLILVVFLPSQKEEKWWIRTYSVMACIGAVVSVIYGSIATFVVQAVCPTCMGIYVLTALQLVVAVVFWRTIYLPKISWPLTKHQEEYKEYIFDVLKGGVLSAAIVLCAIVVFLLFGPPSLTAPAGILKGNETVPSLDFSLKTYDISVIRGKDLDVNNDFRKGRDDAKVTIVEFSDFQCPACMKAAEQLKAYAEEFKDDIQIVFKNYPLDRNCNPNIKRKYHDYACEAAVMARCVGRTGKFWDYHDTLFSNRREINTDNLNTWALNLSLTQDQIDYCRLSKSYLDIIQRDIFVGNGLQLTGSPTIFVNGRKFIGKTFNSLKTEIQRILAQTSGEEYSPMDEIKKLIDSNKAVLIDVREPDEWAESHLTKAVSLPLSALRRVGSDHSVVDDLSTDQIIYVHCRSGKRAEQAAQILESLNYTVRPLVVQYEELIEAGFESTSGL